MPSQLLLPNKYKKPGWLILIPATILGLILAYNDFTLDWIWAKVLAVAIDGKNEHYQYLSFRNANITNTIVGACFIIGALMVSFSKEKNEDEYIAGIRLNSLLWAVWISYILLFIAFVFVYGSPFLDVMVYNMFTILIIFIIRFNYILYRNSKSVSDEK